MNDKRLTDELATRIMGWRPAPGRFLKADRSWIPRWRFRPLAELADAFRLLDHAADHYTLTRNSSSFVADVQIGAYRGKAIGEQKARTISVAVARALRLEVEE